MATIHLLSLLPSPLISKTPFLSKPSPLRITLSPSPLLSISHSTCRKPCPFLALFSGTTTEVELEAEEKVEEEVVEEEVVDEGSRTRIIAQNVPWESTVDDIRPLFEKFGTVVDIELSMYNKTRNRGLAFITMGSNEEASAALSNPKSFEFEGRTLSLAWAKSRKKKQPLSTPPKQEPSHNLYVANLPWEARAKDLREFFKSNNANAVSADIVFRKKPRISAGYGFVSFYTKEEAEAALLAFQGKEFMGRTIRLAPSKRLLGTETKAITQIETENELTETSSNAEISAV